MKNILLLAGFFLLRFTFLSAQCDLQDIQLENITCNDNGTPDDLTDDFTQFSIDPGGNFLGAGYSVSAIAFISGIPTPIEVLQLNGLPATGLSYGPPITLKLDGNSALPEPNYLEFEVTVSDDDDPNCTISGNGETAYACSFTCEIIGFSFSNIGQCDDNGTPANENDDFFTVNVEVFYSNTHPNSSLVLSGADVLISMNTPAASGANLSHTFTGVKLRANGQITQIRATIEDDLSPDVFCTLIGTGPSVNECSNNGGEFFACPPRLEVDCDSEMIPNPDAVSNPNCPGVVTVTEILFDLLSQTCQNQYEGILTYIATDACGNTGTCSHTVQVLDNTDPVIVCPPDMTVSCASEVPDFQPDAAIVSDNCEGEISVTLFSDDIIADVSCANKFNVIRRFFAEDICGNTASCTQTIAVRDETDPLISCPPNTTVSCAGNVPPANIQQVTVTDNCLGTLSVFSFPGDEIINQTCPNRFVVRRSYFAVDACGNSANCIQTITVSDLSIPQISCPPNATVSCAGEVPAANIQQVTATDNCPGSVSVFNFPGDLIVGQTCANRFTVRRSYFAVDACGNSANCIQEISVNDQSGPVFSFVPANITVDCYLVPPPGVPAAIDNCNGPVSIQYLGETRTPGICPVVTMLTRTWRATDACGNSKTASQVISLTDNTAPQFLTLPEDRTVECGSANSTDFQTYLDQQGGASADDCSPFVFTTSLLAYNEQCGNTFTQKIRFIATDQCGNSAFRDATYRVTDQTPPQFLTPPQNLALECDATDDNGESAFYNWLDNNAGLVAEDACGGNVWMEKLLLQEKQGCGNTWSKVYEFRIKDACGNWNKTTATFSIEDHTPPTIQCPANDNVFLTCVADVPAPDPASLVAWDCNGVSAGLQDTWRIGTGCPGYPMTVAYRYAVTDACNNTAICERAFYVRETTTPTLTCPDTLYVVCVDDIPAPSQLFAFIQTSLTGDCPDGLASVQVLSEEGGSDWRSYHITARNRCGLTTDACQVVFKATGICTQFCTASQATWGDPGGMIGNVPVNQALEQLLAEYGPVKAGGGNHTVSASDPACVQEMLFASGHCGFLPTGDFTCPLPSNLSNSDGTLNNQLAANVLALQLNLWYNTEFNQRNLGDQLLANLPPCLVEYALQKDLGQFATVNDLLALANRYLQGFEGHHAELPALLNAALDNLNRFRENCGLNAPCERPAIGRRVETEGQQRPFSLYPNPATEFVELIFESAGPARLTLEITDGKGVIIARQISAVEGKNSARIDIRNLPAGIYGVGIRGANRMQVLRLVKISN
ncbi:MAG: T9SS type A sorting domain-containing protein [Saprospiraceae bacterium]|nr:T9SS type A sorting domain-containing protein [Saprospiraceae bacterium]